MEGIDSIFLLFFVRLFLFFFFFLMQNEKKREKGKERSVYRAKYFNDFTAVAKCRRQVCAAVCKQNALPNVSHALQNIRNCLQSFL